MKPSFFLFTYCLIALSSIACSQSNGDSAEPTQDLALESEFEIALTSTSACSDTWFHAYNEDGSIALSFYAPEISSTGSGSFVVGEDDFSLHLELGDGVHQNFCTDALIPELTEESFAAVVASSVPLAEDMDQSPGVVSYNIDYPPCEDCGPIISLQLSNVWFQSETTADRYAHIEDWITQEAEIVSIWGG